MRFLTAHKSALGLGRTKDGWHHWWLQRVTAIVLIPLTLWNVFTLTYLMQKPYEQVMHWLSQPLINLLFSLWIAISCYHAILGIKVITEDYITPINKRIFVLLILYAILIFTSIYSILVILRILLN